MRENCPVSLEVLGEKLVGELLVRCSRESLGEKVGGIVGGGNFGNLDKLLLHPVSNMMNSDVNMLRALVVHGVVCQVRCSSVIEIHWNRCVDTEGL